MRQVQFPDKQMATQQSKEKIKEAAKEIFGETPTDEAIWKSIRHKDIAKKIRDFLWKHAHGIYKLEKIWTHIPGLKSRATCPLCDKYDTFNYIISECESVERGTVWHMANQLWGRRHPKDLHISEGTVLGGGLANCKRDDGNLNSAKNRLYRILITRLAHVRATLP